MPSLLFTSRPIVSPHRFDIFFYPCKFSGRRKDENLMVLSQDDSKCPNQMNPNGPWWIWPCAGGRCHPTKLTPFVNIPLCFFWIALFNFFRVSQYHATVIVYSWAKKSIKIILFRSWNTDAWFFLAKFEVLNFLAEAEPVCATLW